MASMASITKPFYIEPEHVQPVEFVAERRSIDSTRSRMMVSAIAKYKVLGSLIIYES